MSLTYNTLVLQIESYLNNTSAQTIAQIPYFIDKAQQRLTTELPNLGNVIVVVGNMIAGTNVYAKPGRWRSTLQMNYGSGAGFNQRNPIYQRDYSYLRLYWGNDTVQAPPQFYADYQYSFWLIAPTPDQNYPYEISYLELPELLSPSNQTNYWTNYLPQLLVYCCLLEAQGFLKNSELVPLWSSFVDRTIQTYKTLNHNRLVDEQSKTDSAKLPPNNGGNS